MHSIESYLRRQSTEQLRQILQMKPGGRGGYPLDTILLVCQILEERYRSGRDLEDDRIQKENL